MFYRKEDVDEAIICGICTNIYKDPRFLPCSESACHECIQSAIQNHPNKEFDCNFCHSKHTPSGKDGFPLNGALMKLMKAKADSVDRGARIKQLTDKLVETKDKCDEFRFNLENGVDQVREHCIRLRNQVHLETDILIEEIHKFNESLIAEIDKYEQECIYSFNSKITNKDNEFDKFIVELNVFYTDNTKYLTEFKIDERVIDETISKAEVYLKTLIAKDRSLKGFLYNGKVAEFRKVPTKIDRTFIGTLFYKSLSFDVKNLKKCELKFTNDVVASFFSNINIFKNDNGSNFAFYIDANSYLNMARFDNNGNVVKRIINPLQYGGGGGGYSQITELKVAQTSDNFIFYTRLIGNLKPALFGHQANKDQGNRALFFTLNQNFDHINHNANFPIKQQLLHMAANSSRIILIDLNYNYCYLNINFTAIPCLFSKDPLFAIHAKVGNTIVDVQMNDKYSLFLCNDKKLKIFEIESGKPVKEIETAANQMKLASADRLILFDSVHHIVHLYEQIANFCKLGEVDLSQSLDGNLKINRDRSNWLAFYNSNCFLQFVINCILLDT
jgi:hypothetical protein